MLRLSHTPLAGTSPRRDQPALLRRQVEQVRHAVVHLLLQRGRGRPLRLHFRDAVRQRFQLGLIFGCCGRMVQLADTVFDLLCLELINSKVAR